MDPSQPTRLRALEDWRLIMTGADGTNGRFGSLRAEVAGHSKLIKAIAGAAIASVVSAAVSLYSAGQKSGAREQELQFLRAEVASLRSEVRDLRALAPAFRFPPVTPAPSGDKP
jgi:hypothetical protein